MEEKELENSHKSILKATGIFGFSQLFKILIGIVSSKFVAVFLGPVGIGTIGLLNNTLSIITSTTNFGLNVTGIREIAVADAENDKKKLSETIILLERIALFVGLLGAVVVILFSTFLSQLTFGTSKYYVWFIILSVNFIISSFTLQKAAILQGTRKLKLIAVSSVLTSLFTAIIIIPIYYYLRFDGILPALLATSIVALLVNLYFASKTKTELVSLSFSETIQRGKPIMALGFLLSINVIFGQVCTYLIKLYLNDKGTSTAILGFYEVSNVLLLSYVGMIFTAMSTDFYPRLSSINTENFKIKQLVNDQIEIALLLITPAILFLYFSAPFMIEILYSKEFVSVLLIFKAALFAIIIKAIIWPLAFIILAKGEKKLYFIQELVSDFVNVSATIILYHYFGLIGIGLAMLFNYAIYGLYVYFLIHKKFEFGFRKETISITIKSVILGLAASLVVFLVDYPYAYFILGILFLISIVFSINELNKRVDLLAYLGKIKKKFRS